MIIYPAGNCCAAVAIESLKTADTKSAIIQKNCRCPIDKQYIILYNEMYTCAPLFWAFSLTAPWRQWRTVCECNMTSHAQPQYRLISTDQISWSLVSGCDQRDLKITLWKLYQLASQVWYYWMYASLQCTGSVFIIGWSQIHRWYWQLRLVSWLPGLIITETKLSDDFITRSVGTLGPWREIAAIIDRKVISCRKMAYWSPLCNKTLARG